MTDTYPEPSPVTRYWDDYWRGTGAAGAYSSGGANHPAIQAFWDDFFSRVKSEYVTPSMLDVASGNGAVVERALAAFEDYPAKISCVDISAAAVANIKSRFDSVHGIVCDARSVPLESACFDIITSQFGIEYSGEEAISEAVRLLDTGGSLALLMHSKSGVIYQECSENLEAINRFRESGFIPGAHAMFKAGFEAVRGADRAPYDEAAKQLTPAVTEAEAIMRQFGADVADDTISRLYGDVAQIHAKIQYYDPQEVLSWLEKMDPELEAFAGRMQSMIDAAIDNSRFEAICSKIAEEGCHIDQAGPFLAHGHNTHLGWVIVARKQP